MNWQQMGRDRIVRIGRQHHWDAFIETGVQLTEKQLNFAVLL